MGMATTTMNDIPDELLTNILAFVPFSEDQFITLALVSRRFENVVNSVSWRKRVGEMQFTESSSLYYVDSPSQKDIVAFSRRTKFLTQISHALSLTGDNKNRKVMLETGVQLLEYLLMLGNTYGFASRERFAFWLLARRETAIPFVALCLRFTISRIADQVYCEPNLSESSRLVATRAFETVLLLKGDLLSVYAMAVQKRKAPWNGVVLHLQNRILESQLENLQRRHSVVAQNDAAQQNLTTGQAMRATFFESYKWRVLSGPETARYVQRIAALSQRPPILSPVEIEKVEDELCRRFKLDAPDAYDDMNETTMTDYFWHAVSLTYTKIALKVKHNEVPDDLTVPDSLELMCMGLAAA